MFNFLSRTCRRQCKLGISGNRNRKKGCNKESFHKIIFAKSWNEWAEGAYLEPDEKFGYQYLEAVRDALTASVLGDENNVAVSIVSNRTRQ